MKYLPLTIFLVLNQTYAPLSYAQKIRLDSGKKENSLLTSIPTADDVTFSKFNKVLYPDLYDDWNGTSYVIKEQFATNACSLAMSRIQTKKPVTPGIAHVYQYSQYRQAGKV